MILTSNLKIIKTVGDLRSVVDNIPITNTIVSITHLPVTLAEDETQDLECAVGMVIVSDYDLVVTGDLTKTIDKFFVCFAPLSLTITNSETTDISFTAYLFD